MSKVLKEYTIEEVAQHNKEDDVWVIIDAKVYDLTKFANLHPGGPNVLFAPSIAGQDATQAFFGLHKHEVLLRPQYQRLQVGTVAGQTEKIKPPVPGALSKVPYAEPSWLSQGYHSPYYTENHRKFQTAVRKFFEIEVAPEAAKCEDSGKRIPQSVVDKMAEANIIAMRLGPGKHLQGRTLMGGIVKPEEFDYFYEGIVHAELARVSSRAVVDGLLAGLVIGLPPVLNYGSKELQAQVVDETFAGRKYVALAITEAFAGSDVGGLQTTAVREGDEWVITGTKKWITNGTFADYFTTGCKTENGFTVILIPRGEGVSTKQIKTAYSSVAGTAYVTFDKVRVPVGNTLGPVGKGMSVILSNFNHERWMVCCTSVSTQRLVVEECLKWATQRIVFGKPLTNLAVIRSKLAFMISRVETSQNWLENVTYQMCNMNYAEQSDKLAGPIGLLKQHISRSGRETAEDSTQIFGGRALTVTGMGKFIENFHRTSGFDAILAGAEDVLSDLGVRQALKKMPADTRL
ncbi:acyl-CoA dehydrogenase [Ephemerocybe angulata]|uniref:Acyl-CoA dehydrogenase n=1 Tax=Ephemerocybe angulata TaxID=980116 RepID=A0A8H6IDS3_9AGAR|nr:acyl-CoA dehydrogenase [Tulosesus angulatus]